LPPAGEPIPQSSEAGQRLQILTTEHWSLLATRSLTWNESFSRVNIFLSVLWGAVIALALVAQATRFGDAFILVSILLVAVVLFVGVATVARLGEINREDALWVAGMNRLRHAYLEMHPELQRYLVSGVNDDLRGIVTTFGWIGPPQGVVRSIGHGLITIPGMLVVIVAAVAAVLASLIAMVLHLWLAVIIITALVTFVVILVLTGILGYRSTSSLLASLPTQFPTPDADKSEA
jgi:hypothetical protein